MVFHDRSGAKDWLDEPLNLLSKERGAKWLCNKQRGGFKTAVMANNELATGAEDDDGDVACSRIVLQLFQSGFAIHIRHDVVEENDARKLAPSDGESFASIRGEENSVTEGLHTQLGDSADVGFVIDDEDGFIGVHG